MVTFDEQGGVSQPTSRLRPFQHGNADHGGPRAAVLPVSTHLAGRRIPVLADQRLTVGEASQPEVGSRHQRVSAVADQDEVGHELATAGDSL